MKQASVMCSIILFLYLGIIFLLNYYKKLCLKKKNNYLMKIANINPTINLFCCDSLNSTKLFWITLLELVENKYYKLYEENDNLYIKINKKKLNNSDEIKLLDYQKIVIQYINNILHDKKNILVSELDCLVRKDFNISNILNEYHTSLKRDTKEIIGEIDNISNYKFSIICTLLYTFQVLYFITDDLNFVGRLLICLPLSYVTIVLSDLLKNKVGILSKFIYMIIFIISLLLSIGATFIWNINVDNYLIIHFIMGLFTYMYPLMIIINIYSIRTNYAHKNKNQKDLIEQINNINEENINNIDYIYLKVLKARKDKKDKIIDEYFEILDL